jgi:hypothetical protein
MVDPAIEMTVAGGQWSIQMDGVTYGGQMSSEHSQDFSTLSDNMLTDEQLSPTEDDGSPNDQYTGQIASIAWAYPSMAADWTGALSLAQRFASRGGMVFMNAGGDVIDVRELASSSGPLGQPVSATLSFSSAEEVTDEQAAAACPQMHPVPQDTIYYSRGARQYCWTMGTTSGLAQCADGCFIYETVTGKVVFPLIAGMHVSGTTAR